MFTVDLVRPVNGLPTDLPSKDRLGLTSLVREVKEDQVQHEVAFNANFIDLP